MEYADIPAFIRKSAGITEIIFEEMKEIADRHYLLMWVAFSWVCCNKQLALEMYGQRPVHNLCKELEAVV